MTDIVWLQVMPQQVQRIGLGGFTSYLRWLQGQNFRPNEPNKSNEILLGKPSSTMISTEIEHT